MATDAQLAELIQAAIADLGFLRAARDALVTHPHGGMSMAASDAAMCRLLTIGAVTAIDKILEAWRGEDFLEAYEAAKGSNGERIRVSGDCFRQVGVAVDEDVLADYVAIKCLRNALVHLGWKGKDQQFVIERGFV